MRILVTTIGSVGDTLPFVALAVGLRQRHHEILFAVPSHLEAIIRHYGFTTVAVGPDTRATYREDQRLRLTHPKTAGPATPAAGEEQGDSSIPEDLQAVIDLSRDAALMIGPPSVFTQTIHDYTQIPYTSVATIYPYAEMQQSIISEVAEFNPMRDLLGLPRLDGVPAHLGAAISLLSTGPASPQFHGRCPRRLMLLAISRHFLPHEDQSDADHITGFLFLDNTNQPVEPALSSFVAGGEPPVVITMGSMVHTNPAAMTELFLSAVERVGCRAILQAGWTGLALGAADLPASVFATDFVEHSWLFPRAAAVVHHAGIGTTAATLRAGVPSVCVPHLWDQFAISARAVQLGCAGPAFLPYHQLSADRLCALLDAVLHTPGYRERATALSRLVQAEQGARSACQKIEQFMGLPPS